MEYSQNFENVYFSLSFFFSLHRGVCGKLKVKVKVARSCQTLCDPMDYTVHGILQARILEWVAFPSPGDLPNPGIKPKFSTLQRDSLPAEPQFNQPEMETTPASTSSGSVCLNNWTTGKSPGCSDALHFVSYI